MEELPFKREFYDPEELWQNAVNLDVATLQVLPPHEHWWYLPTRFRWEFTDPTTQQKLDLGIVVSKEAYELVDKLEFTEPARLQACRRGHPSPLEYYQTHYDEILAQAQAQAAGQPENVRYFIREALFELSVECTTFKISVTKALFKMLGSRVVLDPSAGWGDRILGAAAAGVDVYHGIDPNPNLRPYYDEILTFIRNHPREIVDESGQVRLFDGSQYALLTEDFLSIADPEPVYDTVFTSPPFFDYEIYVEDPRQSIAGRPTVEVWLNEFLFPYLRKAWAGLLEGGYLALHISDVGGRRYV